MTTESMFPSFVVMDLETQRLSSEVDGGWSNIEGFGLAVACTWAETDGYKDWFDDQVPELVKYMAGFPTIVGFNILRFDYRVLNPYCSTSHLGAQTLDILKVIETQLGHRLKLDDLAEATLDRRKSGDGFESVRRWRQGDKDWVVSYCRNDVAVTRDLYLYGRTNGNLKYPQFDGLHSVKVQFQQLMS